MSESTPSEAGSERWSHTEGLANAMPLPRICVSREKFRRLAWKPRPDALGRRSAATDERKDADAKKGMVLT